MGKIAVNSEDTDALEVIKGTPKVYEEGFADIVAKLHSGEIKQVSDANSAIDSYDEAREFDLGSEPAWRTLAQLYPRSRTNGYGAVYMRTGCLLRGSACDGALHPRRTPQMTGILRGGRRQMSSVQIARAGRRKHESDHSAEEHSDIKDGSRVANTGYLRHGREKHSRMRHD